MDESGQAQPRMPSAEELRVALQVIMPAKDPQHTTLGNVRAALEQHFQLSPGTLEPKKEDIDPVKFPAAGKYCLGSRAGVL